MFRKFIITQDGVLKFGHVYLHRDLQGQGERCVWGGGLWEADDAIGAIVLYGRSFDFGPPEFDHVRRIDWSGVGGRPVPLFHLPHWPDREEMVPVFAHP